MNWNYILVEGFCAKNWEYDRKHSKYDYIWNPEKSLDEFELVPNPDYDKDIKIPESPDFCQKKITKECIKCPYLAYSDPEDEFQILFDDLVSDYIESSEPIDV